MWKFGEMSSYNIQLQVKADLIHFFPIEKKRFWSETKCNDSRLSPPESEYPGRFKNV